MNQSKPAMTIDEKLAKDIRNLFATYYSRQLSESIKRGLRAKKARSKKS